MPRRAPENAPEWANPYQRVYLYEQKALRQYAMFLLAAALASAAPPAPARTPALAQARATVRIISGVRLKLDGSPNRDVPASHEAVVHTDGKPHGARLIEFE
jgi:hypothetical protein